VLHKAIYPINGVLPQYRLPVQLDTGYGNGTAVPYPYDVLHIDARRSISPGAWVLDTIVNDGLSNESRINGLVLE
jgi:hypothetical protein